MKSNIKDVMSAKEREAWEAFEDVCGNFLGKKRDQRAEEMVELLIQKWLQNVTQITFFVFTF